MRQGPPRGLDDGAGRPVVVLVAAVLGVAALGAGAWAYFASLGSASRGISVGSLPPPTEVAATFPDPTVRTVAVTWKAPPATDGVSVDGYLVERLAGPASSPACGTSPAALLTAAIAACDDTSVPSGIYTYRITAVFRTWTAAAVTTAAVTVPEPVLRAFTVTPSSTTVTAGTPLDLGLLALDQYGAAFSAYSGPRCLTFAGPGTSAAGGAPTYPAPGPCGAGSDVAFSAGTVTVAVILMHAEVTALTVVDNPSGAIGTSGAITVSPAPAAGLRFVQQPSTTTAGTAVTPAVTVQIQDQYGNAVGSGGQAVSMTVASGPGPLAASSTTTATTGPAGTAAFANLVIDTAGTYTLQVNTPGLAAATSIGFVVEPPPWGRLVFVTEPATTTAGAAIVPAVSVEVQDLAGNPVLVGSSSVAISVASGPGSFTPSSTTTRTTVAGVAEFPDLVVTTAGSYRLRATATGLTAATSADFTVTPGLPRMLAFSQQPTASVTGEPVTPPVAVQVQDQYGNAAGSAGRSVSMTVASGPGPFTDSSTTTATTDAGGVATFAGLALDTTGTYTLRAGSLGLTGADSASFAVTATAAATLTYGGTGPVASRTSSGTMAVAHPAGTAAGDLLLLVEVNATDDPAITPSGWTPLADQAAATPARFRFAVWGKGAGETSASLPVTTDGDGVSAWVVRYRRPSGYPPDPALASTSIRQGLAGPGATLTPLPDATTNQPDATVISLVAARAPHALSLAAPRGFTLATARASTPGQGVALGVGDLVVTAPGSAPASPTWAQAGTPGQWAWVTLAFA